MSDLQDEIEMIKARLSALEEVLADSQRARIDFEERKREARQIILRHLPAE